MAHTINIKGTLLDFNTPKIMGILNVTPNSFYSESRVSIDSVLEKAEQMLSEGADILDIGGYSSRPGAEHISIQDELDRVIPVIQSISKEFPKAIISIDTFRAEVAEKAIESGAHMINDISGGELDMQMFGIVAKLRVPYILMHMKGKPQNMQDSPNYENVTLEVIKSLSQKLYQLRQQGVSDIIVDPGFGFGKTIEHNYKLLRDLELFKSLDAPLLVGVSRKSMIYKSLNCTPEESLNGTTILNTIAMQKGASILRVHDVKPAVEVLKLYSLMKTSLSEDPII